MVEDEYIKNELPWKWRSQKYQLEQAAEFDPMKVAKKRYKLFQGSNARMKKRIQT